MITALDARKLLDGGIGAYIRGLLDAFAREPAGDPVVALADPAHLRRVLARGSVRVAPVRAGKYGIAEHLVVPKAARAAGAALLHEPHYTLPLGWSGAAVVTVHDLIHLRYPQFFRPGVAWYARAMAGQAVRRAAVVITDSEAVRRDVIDELDAPADRVRAIPLGVSTAFAPAEPRALTAFRSRHGLPHDYVLYVGARKRHKNLQLLLDAWATMRPAERPALVLSGAPWSSSDPLARHAGARAVEGSVRFVPHVSEDRELAQLYSGAALYAQPSLAEGFGLPPLEAMACGTPVLSSDAGSLPEVLGGAARLLPPRDPEAWAAQVRDLLANSRERERLAALGLARAAQFKWEKTAAATREAYTDAVR